MSRAAHEAFAAGYQEAPTDLAATYARVEYRGIGNPDTTTDDLKALRDHPEALPAEVRAAWLSQIRGEVARRGRARNREVVA